MFYFKYKLGGTSLKQMNILQMAHHLNESVYEANLVCVFNAYSGIL